MGSGGFNRIDDVTWLGIRERLPRPWLPEEVAQDMRFWEGQRRARSATRGKYGRVQPGRPALVKTWGWTEWRARAAMADVASWWDPQWGKPPADLQPTSSPHPETEAKTQEEPSPASSPHPADLQPTSSRAYSTEAQRHKDPEDHHLSGKVIIAQQGQALSGQEPPKRRRKPVDPALTTAQRAWVTETWAGLQDIRKKLQPGATGQALTPEREAALRGAAKSLKAAGLKVEDLYRAARWVYQSANPRADGARATGDPVETLLRPKHLVTYCEVARDEEAGSTPAEVAPAEAVAPLSGSRLYAWEVLTEERPDLDPNAVGALVREHYGKPSFDGDLIARSVRAVLPPPVDNVLTFAAR